MRAWIGLALCLAACSVDESRHPLACGSDGSCGAGRTCYRTATLERGVCILASVDAGPGGGLDAGFDAAPPCVPATEECNGRDDDCDGEIDEGFDLTTPSYCGSCDTACEFPSAMCVPDGAGGFECGADCDRTRFTDCGAETCVDLLRDPRHCGGCSVRCDEGEECVEGTCRCGGTPDGEDCAGTAASTCCGTRCVDLNTDSEHCGACRAACANQGGERVACEDGVCDCGDCRPPRGCNLAGICLL